MNLKELSAYCLSKTGAYDDLPFGPEPLVIKVGLKMFALISYKSISLKCDPFVAQNLRDQYSAITPGYHLNKSRWNTILADSSVPDHELKWMIDHSYELVFKSLTKAEKEQVEKEK